jgi:GT2 family glycosyltransferase
MNQTHLTPPVCILTTTWNQVEKTIDCLSSVYALNYPNTSVLLVDNGSHDDTIGIVSNQFSQVKVIALPENLGFAKGYNVGLHAACNENYPYIFLINNDTILDPDCLNYLLEEIMSAPDIGMVTAKIYYAEDPKRIWSVGGKFNRHTLEVVDKGDNQIDQGQWQNAIDIDFAPLCGVLIKKTLLDSVGFLDNRFFVYYEDADFCWRVRTANFRIRLKPEAHIWHIVSASSGGQHSPNERYWMAHSSVQYYAKHAHGKQIPVILVLRMGSALHTTWKLLKIRNLTSLKAYWSGLWQGIKDIAHG